MIVRVLMRIARLDLNDVHGPETYPALSADCVGQRTHFFHLTFQHDAFHAEIIVQSNDRCGCDDIMICMELFTVFDPNDNNITCFYETQLAGETAPVEDRQFHLVEPRKIRVSLRCRL